MPARLSLLVLALSASPALAQLAPGPGGYAFPPGGKAGTTVEVKLGGTEWTPDAKFFVHDPRVTLAVTAPPGEVLMHEPPYWFEIKSFASDPPLSREVTAKFTLPADFPPGPARWRVATAGGGGGGGVFVVGAAAEVIEDEKRRSPQELPSLPVTVNGRLRRIEEVDRYRFTAAWSGPVTLDLCARRLGSDFNGVLEVRDEAGRVLAEAVDTEGNDPALTFAAAAGQAYTVAVRDVDYRGYRSSTYRLTLTHGPRVLATLPAAGRRGEKRAVEFVGYGVATGAAKLESVTRDVAFPADPARATLDYPLTTPFGSAPPFAIPLSDLSEQVELAPPGVLLKVPGAVTGRLQAKRDTFAFAAKKGEAVLFTAEARRPGSPLDLTLAVTGPDGKPVAANDDLPGATDARLPFTAPADGTYTVVVADVSGKPRTLASVYRLTATKPRWDFRLRTLPGVNVPLGGAGSLVVTAQRDGGFKEPIALAVTGLPAGVTVPPALAIPAGAESFAIPLTCAKDAAVSAAMVQVVGTAKINDKPVSRTALAPLKGDLTARDADDSLVPSVLVAITMKPPFKVKPVAADGGRRVPRGATYLADLIVERTDGFAGEITLDMAGAQQRHRQGIRGPAFAVPPAAKAVAYPVFMPEWLETARTSRIGLVAMAKLPDPKGTPRWVIAAMDGQITMNVEGALLKLSHPPDELTVAAGKPFDLPLRIARSPTLTGAVTVELVVPEELTGLLTAAPLAWPAGKESAPLPVTTKDDPRLVGTWTLTARATAIRDGHPVVSETAFEVEFTRGGVATKSAR